MNRTRIGFVGLGLMGGGLARNLLSKGFPLLVYDLDRDKMEALADLGAKKIDSPEGMPAQADVMILSLPDSSVVDEVACHSLKLMETGREGLILIDTTTADPLMSMALASELREQGIEMLDATISGTSKMCADRDITFMVGGNEGVFRKCEPLFEAMAHKTFYLGENGSGAMMKLIVNLVLGLNRMVLAEGLSLGRRAGIHEGLLLQVLRESAAYSKAMDMKGTRMIEKDFLPAEGKLAFHLKDVRLMLDLGSRLDFPLILSSMHAQALASQVAKGRGEWDNAAIIQFYEELIA